MKNIITLVVWVVSFIVLLTIALNLISTPSTINVILGVLIIIVIVLLTVNKFYKTFLK